MQSPTTYTTRQGKLRQRRSDTREFGYENLVSSCRKRDAANHERKIKTSSGMKTTLLQGKLRLRLPGDRTKTQSMQFWDEEMGYSQKRKKMGNKLELS